VAGETGARGRALAAVVLSAAAILVAYLSAFLPGGAPVWAPWLFMAGTSVMMVATMALGAARDGGIGGLRLPLVLVLVVVMGGFALVLALPAPDPADPTLWLGLPPRAAVVLYGIGLLPFFLVPLSYAWTFEHLTLGPGDLERIRERALAARREARGDEGT
jgi:hypothetical protein